MFNFLGREDVKRRMASIWSTIPYSDEKWRPSVEQIEFMAKDKVQQCRVRYVVNVDLG